MPYTYAAIRAGLKANLAAAFTTTDVQQYVLADPSPPVFEIDTFNTDGVDYDLSAQRGIDEMYLTVRAIIAMTADAEAQKQIDLYLTSSGAGSVKAAIESDKTLGGACQTLRVEHAEVRPMTSPAVPNAQYVAAEWRVHIWATGA